MSSLVFSVLKEQQILCLFYPDLVYIGIFTIYELEEVFCLIWADGTGIEFVGAYYTIVAEGNTVYTIQIEYG